MNDDTFYHVIRWNVKKSFRRRPNRRVAQPRKGYPVLVLAASGF